MHASQHNGFADLAACVQHGDSAARVRLRQQMEQNMIHIVRRSLQAGAGTSALDRRILAEARRIRQETALNSGADQERLIRIVAERLCASVIANLRPAAEDGHAGEDTLALASGSAL
jgi:hypothetical protein